MRWYWLRRWARFHHRLVPVGFGYVERHVLLWIAVFPVPVTIPLMLHICLPPEMNGTLIKPAHHCNHSSQLWLFIVHGTLSHLRVRNLNSSYCLGTWKPPLNIYHTGDVLVYKAQHCIFLNIIPLLPCLTLAVIAIIADLNLSNEGYRHFNTEIILA